MTVRLITHLGVGDPTKPFAEAYREVAYRWRDRATAPTRLVQRALLDLFEGSIDEVTAFTTTKALARWTERTSVDQHFGRPVRVEEVEAVASFQVMERIADEVRRDSPRAVVLDVTHGFRLQPIVAIAALQFALSECDRRREPRPDVTVVYGREDGVIEDLTPIVTAASWNAALDAFLRFGRADDLEKLVSAEGKALVREQGKDPLKLLARAASELADGLALAKSRSVTRPDGLAHALLERLETAEVLRDRVPLLRPALEELLTQLRKVRATDASPRAQLEAFVELGDWYGRLERFSETLALVREAAISGLALSRASSAEADPDSDTYDEKVRERLATELRGDGTADWAQFLNARNEVQHAEFQKNSTGVRKLRERCIEAVAHLRRESIRWSSELRPVPPPRGFVNCTNHPSSTWTDAQLQTAEQLGDGPVVDVPFPTVPAMSSDEDLNQLVKSTLVDIRAHSPRVVGLQGESVVAYRLVSALQREGVRCVAAASDRHVTEEPVGDGAVLRKSRFRFEGWRPY